MSSLFALDQSSRLVFVSEVQRGLACRCRCVVCLEPLIARQGEVREHHFAHASGLEPCEVSHESLLHRYAKQVIQAAGGLTVPIEPSIADKLGLEGTSEPSVHLELLQIEVERTIGDVRPDLLGHTRLGVMIAIEVAYSSFCDLLKVDHFDQLNLPALEIDLRAFSPEGFEPEAVRRAVVEEAQAKSWLWPRQLVETEIERGPDEPSLASAVGDASLPTRLPEEIVTISGRWVSIKVFPSGDLAVKVIKYDPDVVSMVRSIAKGNFARYSPKWKSWNVPRWRAEAVRMELRAKSQTVSIILQDRG
jgi:competence protein CoiA